MRAQVLGYLKSARPEHGMLINSGSCKFEIREFAWSADMARGRGTKALFFAFLSAFSLRSLR
jgi:hypothetical protein